MKSKNIKPISLCLTLVSALFLCHGAYAQLKFLDRVVATVDKDVVLKSEMDERIAEIKSNMAQSDTALPPDDVLQKQVVELLILERLQLAIADRVGVTISDEQVNYSIQRLSRANGLNKQAFIAHLDKQGISINDLRERLKRDAKIQQVRNGAVQQRIKITEQEIDGFLKSADGQFWISPEYHLGHILVALPQGSTQEDEHHAREKANSILDRLREGAVFAEIAIAESNGPSALKGGDLGWRKSSELPTIFAEVVPSLAPGQVGEPLRSQAGFHILKLYDKKGQQQQIIQQSKARHILLEPSEIVSEEETIEKLRKLREEALEKNNFAELAKEHSEDIGSMLSGGDLGWSVPGKFVPEFEKTMNETQVGNISHPIRTQFGWHIIYVEDRRQEDMTEEAIRAKAARILVDRRYEDELQIWLRELRDEAFVQIIL